MESLGLFVVNNSPSSQFKKPTQAKGSGEYSLFGNSFINDEAQKRKAEEMT